MTPEETATIEDQITPEKIRAVMENHHLNVKGLAYLLYVKPSAAYQWLDGKRNMPRVTWEYLKLVTGTGKVLQVNDW